MSEIKDLLSASLASHLKAKQVTAGMGSMRRIVRGRDWTTGMEALNALGQAEALDPEHADPAWQETQRAAEAAKQIPRGVPFDKALMAFYEEQLG